MLLTTIAALMATGVHAQQPEESWKFEGGALAGWTLPKYRTRNGAKQMKGSEVFSRDIGTQDEDWRPGLYARAARGPHRFGFSGWMFSPEGEGRVERDTFYDQQEVPKGAPVDAKARFEHAQVEWLYEMKPIERVKISAGLAAAYTAFESDLSIGNSKLSGIYPAPQARASWQVAENWEVEALVGGFLIPFENGNTEITEQYEVQAAVRRRWGPYVAELGYNMFHLHLEKDAGDIEEEVVHMRLRGFYVSAGVRF